MKRLTLILMAVSGSLFLTACSNEPSEGELETAMQELMDIKMADFNKLNAMLKRKEIPTPQISNCDIKKTTPKSELVWEVDATCTALRDDGRKESQHRIFTLEKDADKFKIIHIKAA